MAKTNPLDMLEIQEVINKLIENGHGDVVDCLLANESKVYTKKGRLNKSSTCRELGFKSKELEDKITAMRSLLQKEFDLD